MQETFCGHLSMGDGFWPRNWHWPWASRSTRRLQKQHNVSRMLLDIFWSVVCFFWKPQLLKDLVWDGWASLFLQHHFFSYHGVLLWFLQRLLSFLDPAAKWGDFRCFGPILRLGKCNSCYPSWAVALGTAKQCWGMWQLARSSHELNWWIHISWTPKMSCSSR